MFRVEKVREQERYIVYPSAHYLEKRFNRFDLPYDTNWEIYRLYNYTPEDFFKYLISKFHASVEFKERFSYVDIYFPSKEDAEAFRDELENRARR